MMAKQGYKVMDSDMHLIEPHDLWQRYIDPAYKAQAPVGGNVVPRDARVYLGGKNPADTPRKWGKYLADHVVAQKNDYALSDQRYYDNFSQLAAMDREGIDVAILFPSRGLFVLGIDSTATAGERGIDPGLATAIARAYNDWLYDFCALDRKRLFGAAMVAPHDIAGAVAEARRAVRDLGFKAVFLLPGLINKRPWHDPAYDPLWDECQRLGVPVGFHGGGPDRLTDFSIGLHEIFMMWHTFSHSLGPMQAAVSMTAGGVFQRFPSLRAAFLEGNCSWAPWLFARLDEHYEDYIGKYEVKLEMNPSEYFKRNCFVSVESDEATVKLYVDWMGNDNVVFSTDYPHVDSKFPHAVEKLLTLPVSEESKRKFLWDNCARLYDIE
jgi:uncharacterized protein